MPAMSVSQAKAIIASTMNPPPTWQAATGPWQPAKSRWQSRRRNTKSRTPAPKVCSYCGGKIGQGFKQITIPRIIQVRICAACLLKAYNWVFSQIEKEKNDKTVEPNG